MKKISLLLLATAVILMAVGCSNSDVASEKQLQKEETKVLISAVDAKKMIDEGGKITVLDIRETPDYMSEHIPSSINIWRSDYGSTNYEIAGMRAEKEKMEALLGSLGIDNDTMILLYDNKGGIDGARLFWLLEMYGHEKMALIDGGIQGWKASGLDTTTEKTKITPAEYKFKVDIDESKLATLEDVMAAIDDPNVIILDVRSLEEATGERLMPGAFRKGRIPTSIHLEYKEAINTGEGQDTTFKTVEELKAIYEAKGITTDKTIIPYCQSAVRSAHTTFVLTELLGYENVKNYDGSWVEWSYNKELPIETGEIK
ncbi:sulfurtransferase [Oceanirhabdus seepicola]|uniref:Sulfurtransferase n=1 Tax=Oceanirhabdus seepicola TaxID=2828781 RepID=A0A9J6P5G8_9CLOT|nr:sulfurtransferase [Oceanirhabdus seepicola]MCM1991361.1 sulfurtransferase [Oceanirhabdus seepicola]